MARIEVDISDYIDEISDDELIQEIVNRKLMIKLPSGHAATSIDQDHRARVGSVISYLACQRIDRARTELDALIEGIIPASVTRSATGDGMTPSAPSTSISIRRHQPPRPSCR